MADHWKLINLHQTLDEQEARRRFQYLVDTGVIAEADAFFDAINRGEVPEGVTIEELMDRATSEELRRHFDASP